ncbi:HXXEE domain-containing protein [Neobacillus rhizophilus]|uniref:HXXEE domain-containing protein n=1 Tax=Neobacillus rhizophilus TaxID=2833579 RepID=A0A942TZP2_9BACI|nr:HXXEE domain-containing protein [Neobacillus rhizophilus]MBS4211795.1 HXXEE domain-containing protein [Neobacillus rhizophilus]
MTLTILIWAVASVFIIHDFEEIIVMEGWLKRNEKDILKVLPKRFHNYFIRVFPRHTAGFALAVLVEYIGILLTIILAMGGAAKHWTLIGILSVVSILFIHSFTHICQAIILRRYTPGVATAVILLIPFCLYFYQFALVIEAIDWPMIWISIPVGVILVVFFNQVGLIWGKRLETYL